MKKLKTSEARMNIKKLKKTLSQKKNILIAWTLAGLLIAILFSVFQAPVYVTSARWYIQKATSDVVLSGMGGSSEGNAFMSTAGALLGGSSTAEASIDAAILQSPEILSEIINRANVVNSKGQKVSVGTFRKNFKVQTDKKAPFISIEYSSQDPQEAYDVVNLAEEVFKEKNVTAEAKKARLNKDFLAQQVMLAELDSDEAAKKLKTYESSSQVVDIEEEAKQQQTRLLTLENDLASYKAQLAGVQTKISDLKRKLNIKSTYQAIEKSTIGTDTDISTLKAELIDKNNQLIALRVRYTDTHHAVRQLKEEIENIKKQIESRSVALIGKNISADRVEEVKSVKSQMIDDLVSYSTEETALKSKVKAIESTLSSYSKDLSVLPRKKFNITTLKFEDDFQKSRLESIKLSYENSKISEAFAKHSISIIKLDEPLYPGSPKYPNPYLYIPAGILLGLLLGYGNIFLLDTINNKLGNQSDFEDVIQYTFLGMAKVQETEIITDSFIALSNTNNDVIEQYRQLRTNLKFLNVDQGKKNISLIHAEASDKASIMLANLAAVISQAGSKTLIVDANYRNSCLNNLLKINTPKKGLSDCLTTDTIDLNTAVMNVNTSKLPNLDYLPAGQIPPNPSDFLDSEKMKSLISLCENKYDYVLYNLPSFKDYADALIVSSFLNSNILLGCLNETNLNDLNNLQKTLKKQNIKVIGSVIAS